MIGALTSRHELLLLVEDMLPRQSSLSCSSDLPTSHDTGCHVSAAMVPTAADTTSETVDIGDVTVTLPVPVATVGSLTSAVDNNQTVSSLVSIG